jgi:hypothetical protein
MTYTQRDWKKLCKAAEKAKGWEYISNFWVHGGAVKHNTGEVAQFDDGVFTLVVGRGFRRALGRLEQAALGRYVWGCE